MAIRYRPCPDCDGWLMTRSREFHRAGKDYYETYIRWSCTVCNNEQKTQSRDVPVKQMGMLT